MKSFEKVLLAVLFIAAAVAVILTVCHDAKAKTGAFTEAREAYPVTTALLTAKKGDFRSDVIDREKVTDRETEAPETAVLESEAEDERTASEEVETETLSDVGSAVLHETVQEETEHASQFAYFAYVPEPDRYYSYTIAGYTLDPEIGDFLVAELDKYGITDQWFTIALAQMFQESHFNPNAENRNGLDKGIFQYRITYWDWSRGDIFDWRAQIRLYCEQTARRLASGCSIWETVSRHNTSDYGTYNQEYVNQVFQWLAPE